MGAAARATGTGADSTGVTANCFHPGFVATGFGRNTGRLMRAGMTLAQRFARSPERGAETLVWLADSPSVSNVSGPYFVDQRVAQPSRAARDDESARRLWAISEQQVERSAPA